MEKAKRLTDEEAFEKVELAQNYFEDGAPQTALKLLKEARKTLGATTVEPFIKACCDDILRRKKIMRGVKA